MSNFKDNSFSIISLVSALWVMAHHTITYTYFSETGLPIPFKYYTTPYIFFFISGLLCSASYSRSKTILEFFAKRIGKIYPALLLVLFAPMLIWWALGFLEGIDKIYLVSFSIKSMLMLNSGWYPPYALENGSLWTVPIQIQFYILTPLLVNVIKRNNKFFDVILLFVLSTFFEMDHYIEPYLSGTLHELYVRLCIRYLVLYVLGMLAFKYFDRIIEIAKKSIVLCLILYMLIYQVLNFDSMLPALYIVSFMLLGLAYRFGKHSVKIDISYGVYLWHMAVYSVLSYGLHINGLLLIGLTWSISIVCGYLSSKFVESKSKALVRMLFISK